MKSKGGDIINDRVSGILAITRAFGDFNMKNKGVTAEPFIKKLTLSKGAMLIIASDGIWDVINDEVLIKLSLKNILKKIKFKIYIKEN